MASFPAVGPMQAEGPRSHAAATRQPPGCSWGSPGQRRTRSCETLGRAPCPGPLLTGAGLMAGGPLSRCHRRLQPHCSATQEVCAFIGALRLKAVVSAPQHSSQEPPQAQSPSTETLLCQGQTPVLGQASHRASKLVSFQFHPSSVAHVTPHKQPAWESKKNS